MKSSLRHGFGKGLSHRPYRWLLFVLCAIPCVSLPSAFAKNYKYPTHLPQLDVEFGDPSGSLHNDQLVFKPMDAKYFTKELTPSFRWRYRPVELHYRRPDGRDAVSKAENMVGYIRTPLYPSAWRVVPRDENSVSYERMKDSGKAEVVVCSWTVMTTDHFELLGFWDNRPPRTGHIILDDPQLDEVTRCYVVGGEGESMWVSQEFGIRCGGGQGTHANCRRCFTPVALGSSGTRKQPVSVPTADELVGQELHLESDITIYSLGAFPREEPMGKLKAGVALSVSRKLNPELLHVKFTLSNGRTYEGVAKHADLLLSAPHTHLVPFRLPKASTPNAHPYQYPSHLNQKTVRIQSDFPPNTKEGHHHGLTVYSIVGEGPPERMPYFPQLHYCRKDGTDAVSTPYTPSFYWNWHITKAENIELYEDMRWRKITNGLVGIDQLQLGDVTRCYIACGEGESAWVSQEFGIRCGGDGWLHSNCTSCFMPVELENHGRANAAQMLTADELVGRDLRLESDLTIYSLDALPQEAMMGKLKGGVAFHVVQKLTTEWLDVKFTTSNGQTYEGAAKRLDLLLAVPTSSLAPSPGEKALAKQDKPSDTRQAQSPLGSANQGRTSVSLSRSGGNLVLANDATTFTCPVDSWWGDGSLSIYQGDNNKMLGYKESCHNLPPDTREFDMGWDFSSDRQTVCPGSVFVLVNNENRIAAVKILSVKIFGDDGSQIDLEVEYRIY